MDLAALRYFVSVAKAGSINRAAHGLNTVQSNVTTKIISLEASLGTKLFERHNRGVNLTPAGEKLLPLAERMEALLREAHQVMSDEMLEPAGELRIGSMETTAALRLPSILVGYTRMFPSVDLSLQTGPTSSLVEDVVARRLDGAFVGARIGDPLLLEEHFFEEELVVISAPGFAPFLDPSLARRPPRIIVFRVGCSYRERLEYLLLARGLQNLRRLELGTLEGIIACVSAGIGISLLPRSVVERSASAGSVDIHPVPAENAFVRTRFIRRKDVYTSAAMTAFLGWVKSASACRNDELSA